MRENLETGVPNGGENLGETILCLGFFLIYFVEELVHFACDSSLQHDHCDEEDHTQSITVHRSFTIRQANCEAGADADRSSSIGSSISLNDRKNGASKSYEATSVYVLIFVIGHRWARSATALE